MTPRRAIRLAVHFPGVNNTSVWTDPRAGSQIEFGSFATVARTAERAKFDFFFLAEGLRMREHAGHLQELDVAGRPDGFAILAALAAVTERLGLVTTVTTTYHEPHEVARQLGSIDHLSAGRAGWNLVTSADGFTGANFRRGPYLDYEERYLVIEMTARQTFVGSPETVAGEIDAHVQALACDGFILIPHLTPGGLDRFADEVVPRLQERGSFRTEYEGGTLREHLGLPRPPMEPRRARRATAAGTNPDHHTSPLAEVRR